MRFFTSLSFLLFASVALMAQGFAYLNLTTADGAERSIAAAQVKITFADGALVAHGADGAEARVSLSDLVSMQFSNSGAPTALKGDINNDGNVDVSDVTTMVSLVLAAEGNLEICDVNEDGKIDVSDVTAITNIILNGGSLSGGDTPAPSARSEQSLFLPFPSKNGRLYPVGC